ncbi:DUF1080 domain-containing protein [Luteolibacter sp. LG18]|uniref:3-keto-disaccharide hydrolase n=1 Tax=Luteolibacter sp. LG18 TaxID=2819286 RepID=UPI0030C769A3
MKSFVLHCLAGAACVSSAFSEPLFNGKDLTGWKPDGADVWTFADSVLTGQSNSKKQGSVLWSTEKFKDFTLDLDFRFSGDVDSGVFLRTPNDQIQIGTSRSLKRDMTGSPYIGTTGKYAVEAHDVKGNLKEGEWNHFRITAKGSHYTVELNGKQVLDYSSDTAAKEGGIGLQVHPGVDMKIEFRNVDLVKG